MSNEKKKIDILWQVIGLIIALAGIAITVFVTYDLQTSELTVQEESYYNPISFAESATSDIQLVINGVPTTSMNIYSFLISNTGKNPILPKDYIKPLQISVSPPWELLSVENDISSSNIEPKWKRISKDTYQLEPLLLNPSDQFKLLLFVNYSKKKGVISDKNKRPDVIWNARIVNINSIKLHNFTDERKRSGLGKFYLSAYHNGWELYLFLLSSTVMYILALSIVNFSRLNNGFTIYQILYVVFIVTLSYSAADAIFDIARYGIDKRGIGGYSMIGAYLILALYLSWSAVTYKSNRK
ncbi:MAG: hypothetical protein SD837_17500 [Candidatus Electrothrix scaldis]|nr:MAG: hypothetical protein SD837_17500 [Candidatus Electrothrix sp. GW3-3]